MAQQGLSMGVPAHGAGLSQPKLTMDERRGMYLGMRNEGMDADAIRAELGQYGIAAPLVEPEAPAAEGADDGRVGAMGELWTGTRNTLEGIVGGLGDIADDQLGLETVGDALRAAGEYVGTSAEQEEAQARQAQARQEEVDSGELSRAGATIQEVGDMTAQAAPTIGATLAGAAAGAAVGSVAGPIGTAVGGVIGALATAFPMAYRESRDFAAQNGIDVESDDAQNQILLAAGVKSVLDATGPGRIARRVVGKPAVEIVKQAITRRGAKAFLGDSLQEGATEATQGLVDAIILDPEAQAKLTAGERAELVPWVLRKYGSDAAKNFAVGAILGGAVGTPTAMRQQHLANQAMAKDVEEVTPALEASGADLAAIDTAMRDPKQAKEVVDGLRDLAAAERHRNETQALYDAVPVEQRDEDLQKRLDAANKRADASRDKHLPQFGGMTVTEQKAKVDAEARARKDEAAERARNTGVVPNQTVEPETVDKVISPLEDARADLEDARAKVQTAPSSKKAKEYRRKLRDAEDKAMEAEVEARRVLRGEDPDKVRSKFRFEKAVDAQAEAEFSGLNDEDQITRADEILGDREETKGAKAIDKQIEGLVKQRRRLDDPVEIAKVNAQIAQKQAQKALPDPVREAARRAKRAAMERLGRSPETEAAEAAAEAEEAAAAEQETQGEPEPLGGAEADTAGAEGAGERPPATTEAGVELPEEHARYFDETDDSTTVPVAALKPLRARPEGVANAGKFMRKAYDGTMAKRVPISVRAEEDGTYTVLDGNSTVANAQQAGWEDMPVRVVTDEQFAEESAPKFGKKTGTTTAVEGSTIVATGPARLRKDVAARAKKEGLTVRFEPTEVSPEAKRGGRIDKQHPWKDLSDVIGIDGTPTEVEQRIREWTAESKKEASATSRGDEVLAVGTNSHENKVTAPMLGLGDPDVTFTHSHPVQSPPSWPDVAALYGNGYGAHRAILPDGQTTEIRPVEGVSLSPAQLKYLSDEVWLPALKEVLTQPAADYIGNVQIAQEGFLQYLASEGLIDYAVTYTGLTASQKEQINGALDRAGSAADALGRLGGSGRTGREAGSEAGQSGGAVGPETQTDAASEGAGDALHPLDYRPPPKPAVKAEEKLWQDRSIAAYPTVDSLLAEARRINDTFGQRMQAASDAVPGTIFHQGPLKDPDSIQRKLVDKGDDDGPAPPGRLGDVVRGTFVVTNLADADRLVQQLAADPDLTVLDEGWATTPVGYTDRKLAVRVGDSPMVTEMQVTFPAMLAVRRRLDVPFTPGHRHYEIIREPERHAPEEVVAAERASLDLYRSALDFLPQGLSAMAFSAVPALEAANGNVARQSLSGINRMSVDALAPAGSARQPASGLRSLNQTPRNSASASTAGSPSQSANLTGVSPSFGTSTPWQSTTYDPADDPAPGSDYRISTRYPTQKQSEEDPVTQQLQIDTQTMRSAPAAFEHNADLVTTYPGMGDIAGTPDQKVEAFKARLVDNLVWLHNRAPQILRDRGWHWYDGANRIANTWADRYGLPVHGTAGVLAALSPQMDWYKNVSLGERVIDIVTKGQAEPWSPKMTATMNRIYKADAVDAKGVPKYAAFRDAIKGRTLGEVIASGDLLHAAAWVRVYDEANNDRAYSVLSPEGDLLKPTGQKLGWGATSEIAKAVGAVLDPSVENVSRLMGENHKVRSFYNNIVSPQMAGGDVTVDTHAVAAALLRPLSGNTAEVSHALGTSLNKKFQPEGYAAARNAGKGGAKGLYGLYADAYRDAASTLGLLPRQLQSITWEAVRLLYPVVSKRPTNKMGQQVRETRASDELSPEEKRDAIHDLAGGIGSPSWERPGGLVHDPAGRATYKGPLRYTGGADGAAGAGAGGGPAGGAAVGRAGEPAASAGVVPAELRRASARRTSLGGKPTRVSAVYGRGTSRPVYELVDPDDFRGLISTAKAKLGKDGDRVTVYDDYTGKRLFAFDDGGSGFALDGDDIVSVFSVPGETPRGAVRRLMPLAVQEGGTRLDAFGRRSDDPDTASRLPEVYAKVGMRSVAKLPFSRDFMAEENPNWDYAYNGEPDIHFMSMAKEGDSPSPDTDNTVDTYEEGLAAQQAYASSAISFPALSPTRERRRSSGDYEVARGGLRGRGDRRVAEALQRLNVRAPPEEAARMLTDRSKTPERRLYDFRHTQTDYHLDNASALLEDGEFNGSRYYQSVEQHAAHMRELIDALLPVTQRGPMRVANDQWRAARMKRRSSTGQSVPAYIARQIQRGHLDEAQFTARAMQLTGQPRSAVKAFIERGTRALGEPLPSGSVSSPEFKRWFGDSKVVNEDGSPKQVYHGTNAGEDFSAFRGIAHFGTAAAANDRLTGRRQGQQRVPAEGERVLPVYIRVEQPLDVGREYADQMGGPWDDDADTALQVARVLEQEGYPELGRRIEDRVRQERSGGDPDEAVRYMVSELEDLGYDGLTYVNIEEDAGSTSYVVFQPDQVKSAFNDGTYSDSPLVSSAINPPQPGTPTPIYVRRDMVEGQEVLDYAQDLGLSEVLEPSDMHVTVTYSKAPVDVANAPAESGEVIAEFDRARPVMTGKALALPISNTPELEEGHQRYRDAGASHDYDDDYRPHLTLKYDPTPEEQGRAKRAKPFTGAVILAGETQDTLKEGWRPATSVDNQGVGNEGPDGSPGRLDAGVQRGRTGGDGEVAGGGEAAAGGGGGAPAAAAGRGAGNRQVDTVNLPIPQVRSRVADLMGQSKSPKQAMDALRHDDTAYEALAGHATEVDGKRFGPTYRSLSEVFSHQIQQDLARAAIGQPKQVVDFIRGMVAAQKRHAAEVRAATSGSPYSSNAVNIPSYLSVNAAPKTRSTMQAAQDVAKNPVKHASTWLERTEDMVFNRFAPIRRLELAVKGTLGIGAESAYKNAEMAVNDAGRQEALLYYGAADLDEHGAFRVKEGTMGLRPIFDTAVEGASDKAQAIVDWQAGLAARRAQGLHARGIKTPLSEADIAAALAKWTPQHERAAVEWKKHNDANIDFLVKTGRIKPEQAEAMKAEEHYVPFYRDEGKHADGSSPEFSLPEALGNARRGGRGREIIGGRDPGIKKIVGGDRQAIDNLMTNMIRNSQAMASAGMRNRAANLTFDLLTDAGLAEALSQKKALKKRPANSVLMYRDGKERHVVVTDEAAVPVIQAMAGLQPLQLQGIQRLMANIASVFRQGVTLSPAFMVRNAIRGAVSTGLLTSGANLKMGNNLLTGMKDVLNRGEATRAFMHTSGMGDYSFGYADLGLAKNDLMIEFGASPKTWGYRFRQIINKAEAVGTATELGDRIAAFNTMTANGVRADEAAYQALTIMNYGRRGGSPFLRAYLPMVPFLNARLQGLSRLTEGAVGKRGAAGRKQAMMQLALNGAILAIGSIALWGLNQMDDEKREKYKAEPQWKRLNYHIIYLGDTTVLIPKAFELGHLFSSIPEMAMDSVANDMGDEFMPGMMAIMGQTFGFNAIPAALTPAVEATANYSFFTGRPIEGMRADGMKARDRTEGASGLARFIGQTLGISEATGVSPLMIQHFIEGYAGTYGAQMTAAFDMVGGELGLTPAPVGGVFGNAPILSPMMQNAFGSMGQDDRLSTDRWVTEFYNTKTHIDRIYNSAKAAATNGDVGYAQRLMAEVPGLPAARSIINKAYRSMGELNGAIRAVENNTKLSAQQKRTKLQPLITARNNLSKQVTGIVGQIEEQQGATFRSAA